ncbi:lipid A ABC transporter ATP-binding protein/permease MsbA [Candidatus Schneideria nysicola]|uniref:lipid A ABC transporter ATP-binding protein/permease MsbA n=1 Tax=Candidatus Schneideria nysicola TaxID=1081631 RepID=UPI001CAA5732|nr:lipid A ABC transporter ATP-binding protein/permease MsbA [Candidatus Schneideria nysicola]UAJ65876.1 lipid A ABC transporter ATP-binding protein/permease MsbA [Candidatus Schneideria nysicola]
MKGIKRKKNNNRRIFSRLWPIIFPFRIGLIISIIFLILNAITDILILSLLKPLLDEGFNTNTRNHMNVLNWMPLAIISLMILRGMSGFIYHYCLSWVSGKVVLEMRRKLFHHIIEMPVSFFDQQSTGSLLSRITYDTEQIATASSTILITIIREGASILGLFFMMFYYSWQLSLILVIISPLFSLAFKLISNRFRKIAKKIQNNMSQVTTNAEQVLKGHKEILIFGGQKLENERFYQISNRVRQQTMKMVTASSGSDPLIQFITSLALASILYAASFPAIIENLTAGVVTLIFSSMLAMMRPLKSLTNINTQFQIGMAACQTLFSILDMETAKDDGTKEIKSVRGDIIFNHVTFFYPGKNKPSLKDINFKIEAGKTVAFVGRSGSGKSTIVNLLTRFYEIQEGEILLDGIDVREYKLASLRNQIALVSQNVYLFNDTIANNIAYACKDTSSREDIEKAAYMACAMDFIQKMDKGLDTIIGENGLLLSGGQRQRIAIARALLRNCPILVLDEATSALDFQSEKAIQSALNKIKNNRTLLVIAHRLSTVEKSDEIFVLDNGHIIEKGTHQSLLSQRGVYAHLHQLQFTI